MNKIDIKDANNKLNELINELENQVTDQHLLLRDGKPIAFIELMIKETLKNSLK